MKWAELSSPALAAIDRDVPLVMNIAAIEQHGAHLPVGTDAMIGAHFLAEAERRLGDGILLLPQLQVCCSGHHMDFAGTLTVSHETMLAYVGDVLASVLRQGFRSVVLFNSHGGNEAIGRVIVEKVGQSNPDAQVAMMTWWSLAHSALIDIRESGFGGVGHACEFETSLMLHAHPELVDTAAIADPEMPETYCWAQADMLTPPSAVLYRSMKVQSGGTGTVGRPSFASAEKGAQISAAVGDRLRKMLSELRCGRSS
ncbi:creatininase family protein [Sphingomonas koreensis]|nr:creatininase family protein [Sphingomonas koreensis]